MRAKSVGLQFGLRFFVWATAAALAACASPVDKELSLAGAPPGAASAHSFDEDLDAPGERGDGVIYVGSFNIQNFGRTKAGRADVMSRLAEIVRSHDIIAIQEVSDVTERAPSALLDYVNQDGAFFYEFILSPRTGIQADDKKAQEQYAVYFDTDVIELVSDLGLFDDSASDEFQREPHVTHFRTLDGAFEFALINIHTRPEDAVAEIDALDRAARWASNALSDTPLILLGDFNGGCDYASPEELDALDIRSADYFWVVPDDADTNLASKACAYDRIVLTDDSRYAGEWDVWRAFQSKKISDHWPIWAAFRVDD